MPTSSDMNSDTLCLVCDLQINLIEVQRCLFVLIGWMLSDSPPPLPLLFTESESPERPGCRYFIEAATLCLYLSKYYKHCSVLKIADCTFNYFVSPETRLRKHQNFLS